MKTTLGIVASLCLLFSFAGCHRAPAPVEHPTSQELQDFKDGQAFAQDKYDNATVNHSDVQGMTSLGSDFPSQGALLNHPPYFNLGAYYQEYNIFTNWTDSYVSTYTGKVDDTSIKLAKTAKSVAWAFFKDDYEKSGVTYHQFAKAAGKPADELQALVETNPDGK